MAALTKGAGIATSLISKSAGDENYLSLDTLAGVLLKAGVDRERLTPMGTKVLRLSLAMTIFVGVAVAEASPIVEAGDIIRMSDRPGTTGGGEFLMTVNDAWSFITFCLQRTEHIDFTHDFTVDAVSTYSLSDPAANGGSADLATLGRDYLSDQTAYLFTRFSDGTLAGYAYAGPNQVTSANQLQNAIWMFEQELPLNASNPFVTLANGAVNSGAWSGIGHVRALNLSMNGLEAQDQLTIVSEPASLFLLGSGIAVVVGTRRRARGVGSAS